VYVHDPQRSKSGAPPLRLIAAILVWVAAFTAGVGADPHSSAEQLLPWFLLALAIVTAASAGLFARRPMIRHAGPGVGSARRI
jgi:ABC-type branched-subunit amino acid transport system permease subunit